MDLLADLSAAATPQKHTAGTTSSDPALPTCTSTTTQNDSAGYVRPSSSSGRRMRQLPNYLFEDFDNAGSSSNSASLDTASASSSSSSRSLQHHAPSEENADKSPLRKRRRRLRRACIFCRRSHMVCDEGRPCQRCIKRGIAAHCNDGDGSASSSHDLAGEVSQGSPSGRSQSDGTTTNPSRPDDHRNQGLRIGHTFPHGPNDGLLTQQTAQPSPLHAVGPSNSLLLPSNSTSNSSFSLTPPQGSNSVFDDNLFSAFFFDTSALGWGTTGDPAASSIDGAFSGPSGPGGSWDRPWTPRTSMSTAQALPAAAGAVGHSSSNQTNAQGGLIGRSDRSKVPRVPPNPPSNSATMSHSADGPLRPTSPPKAKASAQRSLSSSAQGSTPAAAEAPSSRGEAPIERSEGPASSQTQKETELSGPRISSGGIFQPYPYRKGYANLLRWMNRARWSRASVQAVEETLRKVRDLWFQREDAIQSTDLIELQATWAANVRYYKLHVLESVPIAMLVCRKAGEVYASNKLARELTGRTESEFEEGRTACYELMSEQSCVRFFQQYESAITGSTYPGPLQFKVDLVLPRVSPAQGSSAPSSAPTSSSASAQHARARERSGSGATQSPAASSLTLRRARGLFDLKMASCGLPSLLVVCFLPDLEEATS